MSDAGAKSTPLIRGQPATQPHPYRPVVIWALVVLALCTLLGLLLFFLVPRGSVSPNSIDANGLTLGDHLVPDHYQLRLQTFHYREATREHDNFNYFIGTVNITIKCRIATDSIELHSKGLAISLENVELQQNSNDRISVRHLRSDAKRETITLSLGQQLTVNQVYSLSIREFRGNIDKFTGKGLYLSKYSTSHNQTRYVASTQFEVSNARMVFPCFDEPRFKANFTITIIHRDTMRSLCNTEAIKNVKRDKDWVEDQYATSVKMSTYLVAIVVGELQYKTQYTRNSVKVRSYARPEALNEVDHSLDVAVKILEYFEDYFDIKYPLKKLDLVAIPDFSHGAMENWGLITFKESSMLYKPSRDDRSRRQIISMIVGHEIAHQWFGNLVTMKWWTDLWLNEGFAQFMGFKVAEAVDPEEKMEEPFIYENIILALKRDSHGTSHAIVTEEVYDPIEILQLFDFITYRKGSSIIRMILNILGDEAFKKGLRIYLKRHAYGNAVSQDLWQALGEAALDEDYARDRLAGQNLSFVMENWIKTSGYPYVSMIRDYKTGDIQVSQQRFLFDHSDPPDSQSWIIPFSYTHSRELNFEQPHLMWLTQGGSKTVKTTMRPTDWIVGNVGLQGFYRVNYDLNNWNLLIDNIQQNHTAFKVAQRAQVLDDSFQFARAGELDLLVSLNATRYLELEQAYLPWRVVTSTFVTLDSMLSGRPESRSFQAYVQQLLRSNYARLGWDPNPGEDKYITFLRTLTLKLSCQYGVPECLDKCRRLYQRWMQTGSDEHIPPNSRASVACVAIQEGGETEWQFAWEKFRRSISSSTKLGLLTSLTCTKSQSRLNRLLSQSLNDTVLRRWDIPLMIQTIVTNPHVRSSAWQFIRDNWDSLLKSLDDTTTKLVAMLEYMNDQSELAHVEKFMETANLGSTRRKFEELVESVRVNIRFKEANLGKLTKWLNNPNPR